MYRAQVAASAAIRIFLAYSLATLGLYLLVILVARASRQSPESTKSLISTTIFPNVGNMGLSLTVFALGTEALDRGFVTFASGALFVFGLGPALVSGGGLKAGFRTTIRLPMMWALLVGILLRAFTITLPEGLANGLHLLAGAAIPILLITLGLQISRQRFAVLPSDWLATGLRLGAGPVAAYLAGRILGLDALALKVLVLQCSTPTAVNALLISAEFGGDARKAARVVVVSSLVCFLTIPIVMWLMGIA